MILWGGSGGMEAGFRPQAWTAWEADTVGTHTHTHARTHLNCLQWNALLILNHVQLAIEGLQFYSSLTIRSLRSQQSTLAQAQQSLSERYKTYKLRSPDMLFATAQNSTLLKVVYQFPC